MFFTKRKAIILIIICSIFFILTYNDVRSEEIKEISGNAQIIDGDTIKINSKKIRLHGIDAPEFKQMCKKPYLRIIFFTVFTVTGKLEEFLHLFPILINIEKQKIIPKMSFKLDLLHISVNIMIYIHG